MRLVTYEVEHKGGLGVISKDGKWVYPLRSLDMDYKTMQELIEGISESEKQLLEYVSGQDPYKIRGAAPIEEVRFLAPIKNPKQDVICLGINYMDHAEESARYKKEAFGGERPYAVYFSKRVNESVANGDGIQSHSDIVTDLDYEVELAVVLGRDALHVREEDVGDYILGYSVANDVSARDVQYRHKQNFLGKSLDTFFAMGPVIVTADEFPCPPALSIRSFVNGELRQNSVTDQVFFNIRHIVSELSQGMTLPAGTILITGTPAGVGMGMDPPCFLKRGDVVTCEIDGIGRISNPIR